MRTSLIKLYQELIIQTFPFLFLLRKAWPIGIFGLQEKKEKEGGG